MNNLLCYLLRSCISHLWSKIVVIWCNKYESLPDGTCSLCQSGTTFASQHVSDVSLVLLIFHYTVNFLSWLLHHYLKMMSEYCIDDVLNLNLNWIYIILCVMQTTNMSFCTRGFFLFHFQCKKHIKLVKHFSIFHLMVFHREVRMKCFLCLKSPSILIWNKMR